ncbi:MAG: ATP-dependent protease ATPase subunit HslU [Spirochaetales bacterium]|nr:ATP-dependent protease ATPase subunit HslU [Spirochaetales bacterium]
MSEAQKIDIDQLTPRQIVEELDRYIVGQKEAKKAVALAIRNRVRRRLVQGPIKEEIYPKNIIMIGPTGCGKTEIARRLSRLTGAPFVKVEATKYTEVGYVGRDVESMIRDLVATSVNLVKKEYRVLHEEQARINSVERLLDLLLPSTTREKQSVASGSGILGMSLTGQSVQESLEQNPEEEERKNRVRELLRTRLNAGELEDRDVELEVSAPGTPMVQVLSGPNMEDIDMQVQNMLGDLMPRRQKRRRVTVAEAREILLNEELEKLIDADRVQTEAVRRSEQMGIVFIDELDKIAGKSQHSGPDVSREGVQRDLLPIVEGATVNTRYGPIKTDHILFIAAGAFHMSRPSDLIPELQGRFPIRVELEKLTETDFRLILDGPENSLTRQVEALLATEKVQLAFAPEALQEMARIAYKVNEETENIGARRLNTIMERLLEDLSFEAPDLPEEKRTITITADFVRDRLAGIMENRDLSQYIL